ncbi:MAG: hypothetical protein WCK76_11995 [Elusimicrobiota bacterium]
MKTKFMRALVVVFSFAVVLALAVSAKETTWAKTGDTMPQAKTDASDKTNELAEAGAGVVTGTKLKVGEKKQEVEKKVVEEKKETPAASGGCCG